MPNLITIKQAVARLPQVRLAEPVSLTLEDRPTAIVGPNGGGKSLLVDLIAGRQPLLSGSVAYDFGPTASPRPCDNIRVVTFHDTYGDQTEGTYYQQRWNQGVESESRAPLVGELIAGADTALLHLLGVDRLLDKKIFMLSSGELRRFQLTLMLRSQPRVLVVDNPFIGLDAQARGQVAGVLERLARTPGLTLVLVAARAADVPAFVEQVVRVEGRTVRGSYLRADYEARYGSRPLAPQLSPAARAALQALPADEQDAASDVVIGFHHIYIRYDERCILRDLSWTVHRGEQWALCGPNGAGKSTLLSLVCADNPQAYACDIELFGRRRGSGESIWDIKRHIGYVSPEMYRAYRRPVPAIDIVASGMHDSRGLYRRTTPADRAACLAWMRLMGIDNLAERSYLTLSSGEQRMVLLTRAFVKNPALLILDEPFHGLDDRRKQLAREVIEAYCSRPDKTLIMVSHYDEDLVPGIRHRLTLPRND